MDSYVSFIEQYGNMIGAHMASVKDFLSNNHIRSIGWEYNEAKNSQPRTPSMYLPWLLFVVVAVMVVTRFLRVIQFSIQISLEYIFYRSVTSPDD